MRSGGRGGHRGVLVGRVSGFDEATGLVQIKLSKPVAEGDVVYLYTPWGQTEPRRLEAGGDATIALRLRERVSVKDRLFRLAAADVGELGRDLVTGRVALRPIELAMRLTGGEGVPAELTVTDLRSGEAVAGVTPEPLAAAKTAALSAERARDALGALGGTPYSLADLEFAVADGAFLAVGGLKDLRRRAVAALGERRIAAGRRSGGRAVDAAPQAVPGSPPVERPIAGRVAPGSRLASPPPVVVRLRPGETPAALPRGGAWCLDVFTGDAPAAVARALDSLRARGTPVRVRLPEVLFDADAAWLAEILGLPWDAVVARNLGTLGSFSVGFVLEYPLQGLNCLGAGVAAGVAGAWPAAVTASPEASLEEVAALERALAGATPGEPPALEILAFGRQQVLHTRDLLGRAEGLYEAPGPDEHVSLLLEDAKGYEFPAEADAGGTRIFNARVTNLAPNLAELRAAGVATFVVEQAAMDEAERAAFAAGGLEALAPLASRERSTTGHLFRGVA